MANPTRTTKKAAPKKAAAPAAAKKAAPAKKTAKKAPAKASVPAAPLPPPGWYLDPADQTQRRYWDGDGYIGDPISADVDPSGLGPPTGAAPTESDDDGDPARPKGTIEFRDRTMKVRMPTAEQLAVWKRLANRAQFIGTAAEPPKPCPECKGSGCDTCHGTGSARPGEIMKLYDRALKIVMSVLVDEHDRDWVEDEFLEGRLEILAASEILTKTVDEMVKAKNAKSGTGPKSKPKARRSR